MQDGKLKGVIAGMCLLGASTATATPLHVVKYEDNGAGFRRIISESVREVNDSVAAESAIGIRETSWPQFVIEHTDLGQERIVELRAIDRSLIQRELVKRNVLPKKERVAEAGADDVITLVDNGDPANRIDLTFMGDGYTQDEREKFEGDIRRLVREMFEGDTFKSYLPLFNVHAVFRASKESGIGKNDIPKDTAYKLAREGDTLRAIFPGDMSAIRESCDAAPGCDYPVMIANDPYYGGLGGEVAISTSSPGSGTVVLRHELGHNFGRVGEEYDGGGYFGQNWSSSVANLKWKHWATLASTRAEPAKARVLGWPWKNLSTGAYKAPFTSDGNSGFATLRISTSGISTDDTLKMTIDGRDLPFPSPGSNDRSFKNFKWNQGFSAGNHELKVEELVHDGNNYVSSLSLHEYGADYHFEEGFVGAFPVFGQSGSVDGYRSNHELCLMRNMQSPKFCPICQENNWLEFFGIVKVIDDVVVTRGTDTIAVVVKTPHLTGIELKWFRDGVEVPALGGHASWTLPARDASGKWEVRARFVTPEVRLDSRNLLTDKKSIEI